MDLPTSLEDALSALKTVKCLRASLGEELVAAFTLTKRAELEAMDAWTSKKRPFPSTSVQPLEPMETLEARRMMYMEYV